LEKQRKEEERKRLEREAEEFLKNEQEK